MPTNRTTTSVAMRFIRFSLPDQAGAVYACDRLARTIRACADKTGVPRRHVSRPAHVNSISCNPRAANCRYLPRHFTHVAPRRYSGAYRRMPKSKSEPDVLVLGDHPSAYFAAALLRDGAHPLRVVHA